MKVNGKVITGPKIVEVVIPIGDDGFAKFQFRCLTDQDDFEKKVPKPVPPTIIRPGKGRMNNTDSPAFQKSLIAWEQQRFHYRILRSMDATEGLEWFKVKLEDPSTYELWEEEINESFGKNVANVLYAKYKEANVLDEDMLEEARKSFLLLQEIEQSLSTYLPSAPETMQSGTPASESASVPQT